MSAVVPLSATLRVQPDVIVLAPSDAARVVFRVQSLDDWDAVQVQASAATSVREVKVAALGRLNARAVADDWVVKHKGHEVRDESQSLESAGVRHGSILSVAVRRRRAVR
jgi:hypothetical protein